ncbi:hypothetical protein [Rubritalea marina]|uniref:hypothetical protein n=1 Tax=Rubritalea marina TaxID=361055 RepID=UPI00036CEB81|nr:hypothetical protein [Rubritalea marina]
MPVNGLLLNFARGAFDDVEILSQLKSIEEVTVGELVGDSLPVVVEVDSPQQSKMIHRMLEGLDNVVSVDVIFASVD